MFRNPEDAIENTKQLIGFDLSDGEFTPNFGDLVQAMHRATVIGLDFIMQETDRDCSVEEEFIDVKVDAFAKQIVKVLACVLRQQERAENLYGEGDDEDEPSPTVSMLRKASDDTPVISEAAAQMFKELMAKKKFGTDGASEG